MPELVLIHTVASLVPVFARLGDELMPSVQLVNIVDESLLRTTIREGRVTPSTMRRLVQHVAYAEELGAVGTLVTCSSIGPAVDAAAPYASRPLLRVDEPLADEAIRVGGRVGVVATLKSTLDPTVELVRRRAGIRGRAVTVEAVLCSDAFSALSSGDTNRHDELVANAIQQLADRVDVIVLAQASMARVLESRISPDLPVPILTSPRLGLSRMAELIGAARH